MPSRKKLAVMKKIYLLFIVHTFIVVGTAQSQQKIPINIENNIEGAPITMGIPFPEAALKSIDNVRLLNSQVRRFRSKQQRLPLGCPQAQV